MEIIDWIDAHWIQVTSSGIGLLCVAWGISVIFKTVWGEWRHTIDTKRREPQTCKRDPFHKLR